MKWQLQGGLSPGEIDARKAYHRQIVDWWNDLDVCGTSGATTWEVLEALRLEVSESLNRKPPDIVKANLLTAKAMLMISGQHDL